MGSRAVSPRHVRLWLAKDGGLLSVGRKVLPRDKIAEDIEAGNDGWKIYLVGWISYQGIDDRYTRHFDFAKVYDPKRRRFFPVPDDPDYSHDPDAK
jgi:hypothetical protein